MWRTKRSLTIFELEHLPKPVKRMSFIIFIYFLGWGILIPFFPIYLNNIFGSYTKVGIVMGALSLISFFWSVFLGDISDKVSKRKMIILTLFLYLPMGPIILILKSFLDFIFYQFYHAFTASSIWLNTEAFIRLHSPQHKTSESMGLFDVSWVMSIIIGSAVGGILFMFFGFYIFLSISLFSGLALIISLSLKDKKGKGLVDSAREVVIKDKILKGGIVEFIKNRNLIKLSVFSFFIFFSFGFLDMLIPLFSKALNASPIEIGLMFSLFYLPRLSEGYFSVMADKYGKKHVLMRGLIFSSIFFILIFLFNGLIYLFLFSFLLSLLGISTVLPPIMGRMTELIPKKEMGKMVGVTRSLNSVAAGLSPIVAGIIGDIFGLRYVFLLGSVITFCLVFWSFKLDI